MSVVAAIAVFPILTLLLMGLAKAENVLSAGAALTPHRRPADPPAFDDTVIVPKLPGVE
jgi:hypothetical protein